MFVTQPFLLPVRVLLDKMRIGGGLLDLSAAVCRTVLIAAMAILPGVTV